MLVLWIAFGSLVVLGIGLLLTAENDQTGPGSDHWPPFI